MARGSVDNHKSFAIFPYISRSGLDQNVKDDSGQMLSRPSIDIEDTNKFTCRG